MAILIPKILIFLSTLAIHLTSAQILAIDFGTEFIKAAVVNKGSGKAFSIVETPRSERKFVNSIGFYAEERFYQADSLPKRTRYPKNCFIFNKLLVDSVQNPHIISSIRKDLLLEYITDEMGDPLLAEFTLQNFPAETSKVTLIEVVAMIIKYARSNAEKQIKQVIKDVVLTVPSFWNIKMRAFIIEAAQIADLHVLSLISENTAAAINYALNQRTKNTSEVIMFYNLGSSSLEMSLVEFKPVAEEKGKPVESIFVLGDYAKSYVGGLRFDSILFNYFKKKFQTKYKKQLNLRGAIKLWGEISEVKQVLTANKDSQLFVEGIMDGIDYHDRVTRAEFESMIDANLKEITSPIKRFLFDLNYKPEDIDGVELIGGSSRIPKLQSMMAEIIGNTSKIGTHINADEAMVLGAAFYGANSSKKFKVKGMNLYDGFNFEIRAVLRNLQQGIKQSDEQYFFKNVTVFHKKSRFGLTKQLNFKCKQNIILQIYKEDENGLQLLRSDKIDNIKDVNETDFKVSITLSVDPIQVVQVKKAQIKYKKDQLTTYMEKVKKEKPAGERKEKKVEVEEEVEEEKEQEKEDEEKEEKENEQKEEGSGQSTDQKQEQTEKSEQTKQEQAEQATEQPKKEQKKDQKKPNQKKRKPKEQKQEYQTVERTKTVTKKYQKDLRTQAIYSRQKADQENLQKSRKMLKQYERAEDERKKLAESKNRVEALIYEIKEKMDNEEFLEFVQKSEKQTLLDLVKEKEEWYDETTSSNKHDYDEQSKSLSKPLQKIKKRIHEYQSREVHYKKAQHAIKQYNDLSLNITKKKQWISQEEVDKLIEKINEWKQELDDMYEKMEDTAQDQTCVFGVKDMDKLVEKVKDQYFRVMATPKPKKEKKEEKKEEKEDKADEQEEL